MLVSGRVTVCYMVFIDGWELALHNGWGVQDSCWFVGIDLR